MATYSSKFRVFQSWGVPSTGTEGQQNVFVFGPRYSLHRYTDEDERAEMSPLDFVFQGSQQVFEGAVSLSASYNLDEDSFKVFAENAFVRLGTGDESGVKCVGSYLDGVLFYRDVYLAEKDKPADADLGFGIARQLLPGDYVAVRYVSDGVVSYDFVRVLEVKVTKQSGDYEGDVPATENGTRVVLEEGLPDGVFSDDGELVEGVQIFLTTKFNSVELDKNSYSLTGEDLVIYDQDTATFFAGVVNGESRPLLKGDLFTSYRSLYTGTSAGIQVANGTAEVESVLGKADPDNPISMGVFNAFVGGAPVVFYYVTEGEKAKDFAKALSVAELNSTLYYLVPMSQDKTVLAAVVAHVKKMSTEDVKRWRMLLVCTPVDYDVYTDCEVTDTSTYSKDRKSYVTLKFDAGAPDAVDGDVITVGDTAFVVAQKLNNKTLLTNSTAGGVTGAAVLKHTRTATEFAKAAAASAKTLNTFRAVDIFPKTYGYAGNTYSSMYAAPIIAGMKAYVAPQAPISNMNIPGVDDLADIYSGGYSTSDLDTVAAGGVLVMMQDQRGEEVYVRKQLTTGASAGVLAQSELSMLVDFDYVSYYFDSVMEGFRGAYNVTPLLVDMVRNALEGAVYNLQQNSYDDMIGPSILGDSRVEDVYQDPTNATRIIAHVVVQLPAPFNEMDLYLSVTVQGETSETEGENE